LPIVHIFLAEERTSEFNKALIERVSGAIVETGCGPIEKVRITIQSPPYVALDGPTNPVSPNGRVDGNHFPRLDLFLIEGRPSHVTEALMERLKAILVEVGCGSLDQVKASIQQIPSTAWGIGGKTAQELGR